MSQVNNKSQLIVRKPFKFNGRDYQYGMVFNTDSVSLRKIRNLYNSRFIMNLHEFEGEIVEEQLKEEKVEEEKKVEQVKQDKKKGDTLSLKKS